jgi:hypothetical protein
MSEYESHEMTLVTEHESGAQEWCCHDCGRRFVMTWQPEYSKVVLESGNEFAMHRGAKGDMAMGSARVVETEDRILSDELREALDDLDLDALFNIGD